MTANIVNTFCGFVCVITAINAIVTPISPSKLPKGFIQCNMSEPNFDQCLKGAFQSSISHLANGIPNLNLIKVDPLKIPELRIDQNIGPVSVKLKFKDLNITNLKYLVVNKIHYELGNHSIFVNLQIPKPIVMNGYYDVSEKVLILPIAGKGKCVITLEVSKFIGNVIMKPVVRNGQTYLNIENFVWKFEPTQLNIKLDNLFNGNEMLGDFMNVFINENWHEILNELLPAIEDNFGAVFIDMGRQFTSRIPMNQIFLE